MSLRAADNVSHEERLCGLEVLERQERGFRQYSVVLSYFSFDKKYITSPRKLFFKGNRTNLSLPHKSQLRTRQRMGNHYLLRENDVTSISQGNAHISKEEKSLMSSHIDSCSKERLRADGVRQQHFSATPLECAPRQFRLEGKKDGCLPGTMKGKKKASSLLAINLQFDLCFVPATISKTIFKYMMGIGMRQQKEMQQNIFLIFNPKSVPQE